MTISGATYREGVAYSPDGAMYATLASGSTIPSPTFTGSSTFTGGTVVVDSPVISATQTWNDGGVTFTGWKLNVTNTASAAASLLVDLQIGGSSRFSIRADGLLTTASGITAGGNISPALAGYLFWLNRVYLSAPAVDVLLVQDSTAAAYGDVGSRGLTGGPTKTLTESSATTLCEVAIAAGARTSGELHVAIEANDAADFQVRHMRVPFTAVNKAGAITTALGTPVETVAVSAGTLTCTITITTGASKIILNANAVSSLTQTTLRAKYKLVSSDTLAITAL